MADIRCITGQAVTPVPSEGLAGALAGDGVVWIDLTGKGPEEKDLLWELGVNEWVAEDILQPANHPKAERHPDALFLVVHGLRYGDHPMDLRTAELDVVLSRRWLLTHGDDPLPVADTVVAQIRKGSARAGTAAELLHTVLDALVDEYEPWVDGVLPDRVDALEDALFEDRPDRGFLQEIYALRRAVMRLARISPPQRDAVRRLAMLAADVAPDSEHLFLDIADRLTYVAAQTESLRQRLDTAFDHYQSTVANAQNEVMKVLTVVAAILLPLTVLSGIYGMNFVHMPELDEPWAYPAVLTGMAAIVVGALLVFRYKGWIGGPRAGRRAGAKVAGRGPLR